MLKMWRHFHSWSHPEHLLWRHSSEKSNTSHPMLFLQWCGEQSCERDYAEGIPSYLTLSLFQRWILIDTARCVGSTVRGCLHTWVLAYVCLYRFASITSLLEHAQTHLWASHFYLWLDVTDETFLDHTMWAPSASLSSSLRHRMDGRV